MATRTITNILRAEVSQYKRAMDEAAKATEEVAKAGVDTEKQHRKMEQTAVAAAQKQKQAWTQVGGALTLVGGSIIALGGSMLKTGVAYNQLQQSSRAALTTLTGSAEAANAQMDKLDAFARNSPFAKQVFISAQQQMLGFGIEAQKVIPYLDAIQNSVAATGGSNHDISELSRIISQIHASAKITATDLREFGNRGIDAATLIGSQMGKTGAQIREDITDGALDAGVALDALAAGMQQRFDGAADGVKNTFTGAIDRVVAAWRDLSSELAEPFVGKEGGGIFTALANDAADAMRDIQALPGPVKVVAAAIIGLAGASSLAAGGFLLLAPRIVATRAALEAMGPGANRAARGLGALAKLGGAATVLTAVYQAGYAVTKSLDEAAPAIEEMAAGLLRIGQGEGHIRGLEEALRTLGDPSVAQRIGNVYNQVPLIGEAFAGIAPGLRGAQKDLRESAAGVDAIDQALAGFVREGSAEFAQKQLDALLATLSEEGGRHLLDNIPEYDRALLELSNSAEIAAGASDDLSESFVDLIGSAEAAKERHEVLMDAWRDSRKAARDVANSFKTYRDSASDTEISLSSWVKQIEDQAEALKNFRENLDTLKERNVPKWMVQELENLGEAGALRARQLANSSDEMIARYIAAQREMRAQTKLSVDTFAGKKPKLEIDDTPARAVFDYFFGQVDMVNLAAPKASLHADGRPAELTVKQVRRLIAEFARQPGETKLTALDRASAPIDAVRGNLKRLDGDTAEVTIRTVREEVVRRGFEALNSVVPKGLQVPGSADGGTVPRSGMGYADRWPYLLADGEEVISNRHGQADRWRPLLKAINDNRLADGGTAGKGRATGTTFGRHGDAGTFAPTKAGLRELERHVKGLSRELDKAKDALREERSERDKLMSAHSTLADTIRSQFDSNLWEVRDPGNVWASDRWGGGMDPLAALEGDIAGLRAYEEARKKLGSAGLSTAALQEVLTNAGLEGVQMMAGWSQADLKRYNALHAERAQLQASVPGAAADMIYGRAIEQAREDARQQRRLTQAANQELKAANKRLDRLEKAVKESAKETGRQLNRSSSSAKRKAGAR